VLGIEQRTRSLALELGPVAAEAGSLERRMGRRTVPRALTEAETGEEPFEAIAKALGKDNPVMLADQFLPGVPEQGFRGGVGQADGAVLGNDQHCVRQGIENCLVLLARNILRLWARGSIHQPTTV
jgi:hypothetical protein